VRALTLVIAASCWLVTMVLGLAVAGDRLPRPFDHAVTHQLHLAIGHRLAEVLVSPTDPPVMYALIGVLVVIALFRRRWSVAILAVAGPAVAVLITENLLKPLFDRRYHGYLSYPSGHTVGAVAALTVALLTVLPTATSALTRTLAWLAWAGLIVALTTGLVAMDYHYPTDALGGIGLALGVVLPGAVLADLLSGRRTVDRPIDEDAHRLLGEAADQAAEPEGVVPRARESAETSRDSATSREMARRYFLR
jgi:membrane-associated phospholipid phosphatase